MELVLLKDILRLIASKAYVVLFLREHDRRLHRTQAGPGSSRSVPKRITVCLGIRRSRVVPDILRWQLKVCSV